MGLFLQLQNKTTKQKQKPTMPGKKKKNKQKIKHKHKVEKMDFSQLRRLVSYMKEEPNLIHLKELTFLKDALPWLFSEWKEWAALEPVASDSAGDDDDDSDAMPNLEGEDDDDDDAMPNLEGEEDEEDDDEMPDLEGEEGGGETKRGTNSAASGKNATEAVDADSDSDSDWEKVEEPDEPDTGLVTPDSPPYPPQSNRHRNSSSDKDLERSQQYKMDANDANNFELAVEKYTESVLLNPSPLTYANRAQVLLKVTPPRPNAAVEDCTRTQNESRFRKSNENSW